MKLLLDTHALLWWWSDDPRLSIEARSAISDEANTVLVSAASAWEIATKHRLGRLPEAHAAIGQFNQLVTADGFTHLPINFLHSLRAGAYVSAHRDPFDRMLVAQSDIENAPLVSNDAAMTLLGAHVFW